MREEILSLVAQALREAAGSLEGDRPVQIAFDQPLEIQLISANQAARIVNCRPGTLRTWRVNWTEGIHYFGDGRYNATALKHWVLHRDSPEIHLSWCSQFTQALQAASRRDLKGRASPAASLPRRSGQAAS